ncbi:MAG TPA: methylenetetrahydrofolate--tRNA-(uracil(54)-C(5))-methyltransferase (FADH(2)-oxidizing) TrmFO [Fibrobacteria bacterium]|nr:methylenetetrahydrofolate--tRNA-(uracil(54)-C(5))-methyltransferase (FADH(2)-oxidizing) TrmFO [Fibrobacteria bacterium]
MSNRIKVIGGGLSGCEAALQLADAGVDVELWEMRPKVQTPAHKTAGFAELVCSNSFKGLGFTSAHGLFKEELRRAGSRLIPIAMESRVPAGESLAIDRQAFSDAVEKALVSNPRITLRREEATDLDPEAWTLVATGPLSSDALAKALFGLIGEQRLYFFDSIAPVVELDSVDREHVFAKNRWEKGHAEGQEPDFLNCPLDKDTYFAFVEALARADTVEPKPFEKGQLFEGCLPVEEMARRGKETLRYGPMRPVGLRHPETGKTPFAVIQLRAENRQRTLYNLVGFQTRLKWGTQKDIFSMVPALRNAVYARFGAMHRNTFLNSPKVLEPSLRLKGTRIFCAGQITGAEGYTEAIGTGLYAASQMLAALRDKTLVWPETTCLGALTRHLTDPNPDFQPMNFNFGLLPKMDTETKLAKKDKKGAQVEQCLATWEAFRPFPGRSLPPR